MLYSVNYVAYNGGKFVRTSDKEWKEFNKDNNGKRFIETHRDEWSVYLQAKDVAPNTWQRIQLDLHTKEVKYSDNSKKNPAVMYKILPSVKVSKVAYPKGQFVQMEAQKWKEYNVDYRKGRDYKETARDEWSVYLEVDGSTNSNYVRIQLDLHTKQVKYTETKSPKPRVLYKITRSDLK